MTPVISGTDANVSESRVLRAEAMEQGAVWPVVDAQPEAKTVTFDDAHSSSDAEESSKSDAHRRRLPPSASMDDTFLRELIGTGADGSPAVRSFVRRSKSCGVDSRPRAEGKGVYRLNIGYRDEGIRERCERNTQQLLQTALDEASASSTSAILARKALRYRKILQRMEDENMDISDPSFDVSACLGVRWQRVSSD